MLIATNWMTNTAATPAWDVLRVLLRLSDDQKDMQNNVFLHAFEHEAIARWCGDMVYLPR